MASPEPGSRDSAGEASPQKPVSHEEGEGGAMPAACHQLGPVLLLGQDLGSPPEGQAQEASWNRGLESGEPGEGRDS